MPQRNKKPRPRGNPDHRRRVNIPAPSTPEIEQRLQEVLSPACVAQTTSAGLKLRNRVLTLPVMVAIVIGMVWRQVPSLCELVRLLAREGLLWLDVVKVSQQALSKRLLRLPASLFEAVFAQVVEALHARSAERLAARGGVVAQLRTRFTAIWLADGSTLEALVKKTAALQGRGGATVLAGKLLMLVDALTRLPVRWGYREAATDHDMTWSEEIREWTPRGALLVFDLGFFCFAWFDDLWEAGIFVVTRLKENTRYRVIETLSSGPHYRDRLIQVGLSPASPCRHPLRLVEVLWGTTWYRYVTTVLDPTVLPPALVCELYRRRWRIEEAFLVAKRLLGLSYLWVGESNGVRLQVWATWVFYAVLIDLCQEVAIELGQPIESISVEMVFRGFYHFSVAYQRGESTNLVLFLAQHAKLLGIIKRARKKRDERGRLVPSSQKLKL